jgi:hypothetical protein
MADRMWVTSFIGAAPGGRTPAGQHQLLAGYLGDSTHNGSSFWVTFTVPSAHP